MKEETQRALKQKMGLWEPKMNGSRSSDKTIYILSLLGGITVTWGGSPSIKMNLIPTVVVVV